MNLTGKKALVTGASRGIGRAIAAALAGEGCRVWGTSRSPKSVDWPKGVEPLAFDVSDFQSAEASWSSSECEALGFDIVVNNAGAGAFGSVAGGGFCALDSQIQLLLLSAMRLSQLALPGLRSRGGALVNVSSIAVDYPIPYMSGYNASKAGLSAFTESLLLEETSDAVRIIDFRPGDLRTDFNASMRRDAASEGSRERAVWAAIERRLESSPGPGIAASRLVRALKSGESGTVRAGTFFQSAIAPFCARFLPAAAHRFANLSYYKVRGE